MSFREQKRVIMCTTANRSASVRAGGRAPTGLVRVITAGGMSDQAIVPPLHEQRLCVSGVVRGRDPSDGVLQVSSSATTPPPSVTTLLPTSPSGLLLPLIHAPSPSRPPQHKRLCAHRRQAIRPRSPHRLVPDPHLQGAHQARQGGKALVRRSSYLPAVSMT